MSILYFRELFFSTKKKGTQPPTKLIHNQIKHTSSHIFNKKVRKKKIKNKKIDSVNFCQNYHLETNQPNQTKRVAGWAD